MDFVKIILETFIRWKHLISRDSNDQKQFKLILIPIPYNKVSITFRPETNKIRSEQNFSNKIKRDKDNL